MKINLQLPGNFSLYFNTDKLTRGAARLAARAADAVSTAGYRSSSSLSAVRMQKDSAPSKVAPKDIPAAKYSNGTGKTAEIIPSAAANTRIIARRAVKTVRRAAAAAASAGEEAAAYFREDVNAVCQRDPAVHSKAEAALLYSGVHAVSAYRIAHRLYKKKHYFTARLISQGARLFTGIEIHPGAEIGHGLFIDHGSGVVIGETTVIGDNCTLYQGVTLGGTGKETGKRHPTLGNNVMVGAGAKLLGAFTVGDDSKIAAGAVVLSDVPENSTAVGIPARVVRRAGEKVCGEPDLDQTHIPDPVSQELCKMEHVIQQLEKRIAELEGAEKTK